MISTKLKKNKENNDIEKIFKNLKKKILNSPNDIESHIMQAKENIESLIQAKNYDIFSDILEQIKPINI